MEEFLNSLELGKWVTWLIGSYLVWRFILKNLLEIWLKSSFEKNISINIESLKSQRELILKQLEFERIKLERILPPIEQINDAFSSYRMMQNNYLDSIANKSKLPDDLEERRLMQDKIIVSNITKIAIYISPEFRNVLYRIRKIISCSWADPQEINRVLSSCGSLSDLLSETKNIFNDLDECFFEMCKSTIGIRTDKVDFQLILQQNNFNKSILPMNNNPVTMLAWKFILLPEYYDSSEIVDAQDSCIKYYHK